MLPRFFIDRPIFASAMSIVITLTGAVALYFLPLAQYPRITPPAIAVSITYPGSSPQNTAETVGAPIEQQVNGVEGMLYMSSQMGTDGSYTLTVTFDVSTDLNTAMVMVQNRLALAMPQLPTAVQNQGITLRKKTPDILMVLSFYSDDDRFDDVFLSNYATIFAKDEILRVPGVSDVGYLGQRDYSIRAWLDPQKMAALNLTPADVTAAIRSQNLDAPAGGVGLAPAPGGQAAQYTIDTLGRLSTPEQFGDIIVKVGNSRPKVPNSTPAQPSGSGSGSGTGTGSASGLLAGGLGMPASSTTTAATAADAAGTGTTTATTTGSADSTAAGAAPGSSSSTPAGPGNSAGGASSGGATQDFTTAPTDATGATPTGVAATTTGAPTLSSLSGLSINTAASNSAAIGALSTTAGRGPGRQSASIVRLRDIARVELGAQNYNQACTFDGHQAVGMSVYQLPGTNALEVARAVRAKIEELSTRFPEGLKCKVGYDTTPFIYESVMDVVWTLLEAVGLVALVVMVFLQSWRAVIIPLVAVPVAIVGTFAVMAAVGFSLNNISLFGLVLAIGIVVDDAIVVVENVERWMAQGLGPREATRKAMDEVTGPIIAVALVLCAVFVPCAFISGITGRFFVQFAVTIAVSTLFSTFNSLTLSPALAAILLRPPHNGAHGTAGARRDLLTVAIDAGAGWFFWLFNRAFGAGTTAYTWVVGRMLRLNVLVLVLYVGLAGLAYWVFKQAPSGFVPQQDMGRIIVAVQMPDSWSLQLTKQAVAKIERVALETPGVRHTTTIGGISFVQQCNSSNFATILVILDPFDKRQKPDLTDTAIMDKMRPRWLKEVPDAKVQAFGASPIPGLSVAGGFKIEVKDTGGVGLAELEKQTNRLIGLMKEAPELLKGPATQFRTNTPQLFADVDRTKVYSLGLTLDDVNTTLGVYLGSVYVNSFNAFGRHWQVTVQADGRYRSRPSDINLFKVRNKWGRMVPLGTVVNVRPRGGPVMIIRYNLFIAAPITGKLQPGVSSGQAITAVERMAKSLPITVNTEWTELMYVQILAGDTALYVFLLAVAAVFLALAALYESWTLPLAVILVVPLCLLCSVSGVQLRAAAAKAFPTLLPSRSNGEIDIFVQIGLVVLVGLASKNAILIVEFASQLRREGMGRREATLEASRLRLRPILMTSFAFILGVVPLVIASGAGAEMRRSLGTAVFSGMVGVTAFGVFLTPVFFYVLQAADESKALAGAVVQRVGSALVGGLLGAAVGFLAAKVAGWDVPWSIVGAGGAGALGGLTMAEWHRRVGSRRPTRVIEHAGLHRESR
jgi:multidrug efflux pump